MKTTGYVGLLALAGLFGCSGRFEVGQMNVGGSSSVPESQNEGGGGHAGTGSAQGGEVVGTAGQATGGCVPGQMDCGNAGEGQPVDPLGEFCVPLGKPVQLAGDFAEPAVVWSRLSPLIWGGQQPPPSALPAKATYKWAGQIVSDAFASARDQGTAPGALAFVEEWLFPTTVDGISGDKPELETPWDALLVAATPALQTLLRYQQSGRVGVFSERNWLSVNQSISRRGAAISSTVFNRPVPPPPPNVNMTMTPPPGLTRRQALEQHRSNPACAACHQLMDPLAYPFEIFDSSGHFQQLDNNLPIDTSGQYQSSSPALDYQDADDFGRQVVKTCDGQVGLADGFLKAALILNRIPLEGRQPLFEANAARIRQAFVRSERTYEDLVRAYAQSPLGLR